MRPIRFSIDGYAELLGVYLGDGCISDGARTSRLRIACDPKYPRLIDRYEVLLRRVFCANKVGRVVSGPGGFGGSCTHLYVYHRHLACLFPQHARGKKHERRVSLEDWQLAVVLSAPWAFLRGCFHTDGCRFVNRTGPYEYPSYHFGNRSGDIARLVHLVCSRVGVQSRLTHWERREVWSVRINRRDDVLRMDQHIGPKR
jgi:hypothetical protein